MDGVKKSLRENLKATKQPTFVPWMIHMIRANFVQVLRIHVSGDFYSTKYIQDWVKIVKRCPQVQFFAYTRTWRVSDDLPAIIELGKQPNVKLWFSADATTERPPKIKGIRTCYLAMTDADRPRYKVDLVFRERPQTPMKRSSYRALVCPPEQGIARQVKITCSTCQLCFTSQEKRKFELLPVGDLAGRGA